MPDKSGEGIQPPLNNPFKNLNRRQFVKLSFLTTAAATAAALGAKTTPIEAAPAPEAEKKAITPVAFQIGDLSSALNHQPISTIPPAFGLALIRRKFPYDDGYSSSPPVTKRYRAQTFEEWQRERDEREEREEATRLRKLTRRKFLLFLVPPLVTGAGVISKWYLDRKGIKLPSVSKPKLPGFLQKNPPKTELVPGPTSTPSPSDTVPKTTTPDQGFPLTPTTRLQPPPTAEFRITPQPKPTIDIQEMPPPVKDNFAVPTPEAPKAPREEIFPSGDNRSRIEDQFNGKWRYGSTWGELTPVGVYAESEEFARLGYSTGIPPDLEALSPLERMRLFAYSWERISATQFNHRAPDSFTPLGKISASFKEENYSKETLAYLSIILQLVGQEPNYQNLLYACDLLNFQYLTINFDRDYLLRQGEYEAINNDINQNKKGVHMGLVSDALLKLLNWQDDLTLAYLMNKGKGTVDGRAVEYDLVKYLRDHSPTPVDLPKDPQAGSFASLVNQRKAEALHVISQGKTASPTTPVKTKTTYPTPTPASRLTDQLSPTTIPTRALTPSTETTISLINKAPFDRWVEVFDIAPQVAKILHQREGGNVEVIDGLYQVTRETRASWATRIPSQHLNLMIQRFPEIINLSGIDAKTASDILSKSNPNADDTKSINRIRDTVLRLYDFDPTDPNSTRRRQISEEIQTYFGLWFFNQACLPYGNERDGYYLSFLQYNHPAGVDNLLNQFSTQGVSTNRSEKIALANQLIRSVDEALYNQPVSGPVQVDATSLVLNPSIRYEIGRSRFYWVFQISGKATINGKSLNFTIPSAHYLWSMRIVPQDKDVVWQNPQTGQAMTETEIIKNTSLQKYAHDAVDWIASEKGFEGAEKSNLQSQLLDDKDNPQPGSILTTTTTGRGVMDWMFR